MKFLISTFLFLLFSYGISSKTIIKYAILAPRGTVWARTADSIRKRVKSGTNNQVEIKVYYGGSQGTEQNMINLMKTGSLDMASFTGIGLGQIISSIKIMELPLFFADTGQIDRVRKGLRSFFNKEFQKKGFHFMGWGEVGWIYMFTNKKFNKISDFKGRKTWAPKGDLLVKSMLDELNIIAHPYPIPAVYPRLQSGQLDGVLSSTGALVGLQWHNYVNYVVLVKLSNGTGATLLSNKGYNKIPPQYRTTIRNIINDESESLIRRVRIDNKRHSKTLEAAGIKGIRMNAAQKNILKSKAIKVHKKMVGKLFSNALLQKALSLK